MDVRSDVRTCLAQETRRTEPAADNEDCAEWIAHRAE